jgi:hypothetical protein
MSADTAAVFAGFTQAELELLASLNTRVLRNLDGAG